MIEVGSDQEVETETEEKDVVAGIETMKEIKDRVENDQDQEKEDEAVRRKEEGVDPENAEADLEIAQEIALKEINQKNVMVEMQLKVKKDRELVDHRVEARIKRKIQIHRTLLA